MASASHEDIKMLYILMSSVFYIPINIGIFILDG
jgi:hypothetical protein